MLRHLFGLSILRKVWPDLLVGIGVEAVIHGWAPETWFAEHDTGPLGVPIGVDLGVALYSNAAGVMPLVEVLCDKGMPMGTLLAFMMSVVALCPPEMIVMRCREALGLDGIIMMVLDRRA